MVRTEKLRTLCDAVVVGHVGPSSSHRQTDGIPFLMGKNVGEGFLKLDDVERVTPAFHAAQKKSQLRGGDVVVVRIGKSGLAAKIPDSLGEANCSGLVIVRGPRRVLADYLVHYLNSPQGRRQSLSETKGSTRQTLNTASVAETEVPLLPLPEQRRIAAILDKADDLRAKRRTASEQLNSLTQSIFLEMFGDPATNPKLWPVVPVSDLLVSACYGTSEKAGGAGAFPILRMGNITATGDIDVNDLKFIDLKDADKEKFTVRVGDILFNRTNSPNLVGKSAMVRNSTPMAFAGYLIRLRVNDKNNPEYLSAFLNSAYAKRVLRNMCKAIIGMANINATEIQRMTIPKPPLDLQNEFARMVARVERLKGTLRTSSRLDDDLFNALQHRAFSGSL